MMPGLLALAAGCGGSSSPMSSGSTTGNKNVASNNNPTSSDMNSGSMGTAGSSAPKAGASGSSAPKAGTAGTGAMQGGTAGAGAPMGGTAGSSSTTPTTGTMGNADMNFPDPRGACDNLNSGFPDDHACILPPDPSEGMQIHVGPTDYTDQTQISKFIFHPGMESAECWTFHTPNDKEIDYQTFVLSGRAGTHHIINTMYMTDKTDGGFTACADPGTGTNPDILDNLPGASKAYMARGKVAPENVHIGRKIGPHAPSQADMHYFNFTDKDIIREFWMNIYFAPPDTITDHATQIRGMGGLGWTVFGIAPGTDMTYSYQCPITADGRIMALLGHYHSHGKHFTASIKHTDGTVDKVFEMYDYLDPAQFEYDSITTNPSFTDSAAGAVSGILNVKNGETLLWDCHIINDSMTTLTYTNAVKTGEMCNLWGESLGPTLNCVLP